MKKSIAYVGNDVHLNTTTIAVYEGYSAHPVIEKKLITDKQSVQRFYKKLSQKYEIQACYEASGCGYVFYRWLKEIGVSCSVIAPGSIPKQNKRVKTDRIDANKLAKCYRNHDVSLVHVPTSHEESIRSITRLREQIVGIRKRTKQHILKFLQLHGVHYQDGSNWTKKHVVFLQTLKFSKFEDEFVFSRYLEMLSHADLELESVDAKINEIAFSDPIYKSRVAKLRCFRGIDTITSMSLLTEVIDFRRFGNPKKIMSFFGLVPSESSSGELRQRNGITKTGNSRVRRLLIESAWHYRHRPNRSQNLKKRQLGQDPLVVNHCWKAQKRLHAKYYRLYSQGKCTQKSVTAVARELVGFIWAVMTDRMEVQLAK